MGLQQQQRCSGGITFTLTRRRVKNLNLRVRSDGSVAVSAPSAMPLREIDAFVASRAAWVTHAQEKFARRRAAEAAVPLPSREEALAGMQALCRAWWPYFEGRCPGPMPAVRVRDMHTRWGSCSGKGNLNFHWKLILMPPEVLDYVVVHELAHLKEMNHSPRFWAVVEAVLPDYKERRQWLKENGGRI